MAIRVWKVVDATGTTVMTLQGKQKRTMEKAVQDYILAGRLPYGEYRVELIGKERN